MIICDPKSELYETTSQYLREQEYTVRVFNLVSPEHSDSWACLSEIKGDELMPQPTKAIISNEQKSGIRKGSNRASTGKVGALLLSVYI